MTIRQLWTKIIGEKPEDPLVRVLEMIAENQKTTTESVMGAVKAIGEASQKQAQVLESYLKLFSTPGEPQRWENDPTALNESQLIAAGFPKEGSEAEQAQWILDNLDRI